MYEAVVSADQPPLEERIEYYADLYDVSAYQMSRIIQCESGGQPIQSAIINSKGVREDSWGIVQIHLPSHPNITREQALDTDFSLEFLAKNLKAGRISMWHGYNPKTDTCSWAYSR